MSDKPGACLAAFRNYFSRVRLFQAIGSLTFAGHAGAALATNIPIPNSIRMVFENPTYAETGGAIRIYHPAKVLLTSFVAAALPM